MADNRSCQSRDTAYIDTNRIFDSCRAANVYANAVFSQNSARGY